MPNGSVMADPVMASVASALARMAAEAAFETSRNAWRALVRLVRDRFARDDATTAVAALQAAQARPDDQVSVAELAAELDRIAGSDDEFAAGVRALWPQASVELSAREGGVVNSSTGAVGGHLIQVRDLHVEGGLHLGDISQP